VLIAINWGVFIWAVSAGKVLEASLGYFITPLINVMLGVVVLKERLRSMQVVGIALASIGVVVLTARLGHVPWVAVALAISFSGYGLLRKVTPVGPVVGLTIETAILLPMAVVIIARDHLTGDAATANVRMYGLLMASSVVTAVPLLCFAAAAKRLRLGTLGFLQYISPTCQFLLAVVAFGEAFTRTHLVGFSCIWVALGLYSIDSIPRRSAVHPLPAALLELDA